MQPLKPPISSLTPLSQLSFRSRLTIIGVVFWGMVALIQDLDWKRGIFRAVVLVLMLATTPVLMWLVRRPEQPVPRRVCVVLAVCCAGLLCWHFFRFIQKLPEPNLYDFATTTLSAVDALLAGKNPYSLPIDLHAEIATNPIRYQGYKYLPMMIVTYLPLGIVWGERGILMTNFILDLATVMLVFRLSSRIGSYATGWFAALLYLSLPIVPLQIYKIGATDLAAIVPLLIALLHLERRPGLAGLCVGLSVSTKLLPGIVFIPCYLPNSCRGRYAAGIVLGLVPTLVFLVLSPNDLIYNTVFFNANRPVDSTSWLHWATPEIHLLTTVVSALAVLGVAVHVWYNRPTIADRCGLGIVCLLSVMLSSPIVHRNYQLWWLPFFAVLLGTAAFRGVRGQGVGRGNPVLKSRGLN